MATATAPHPFTNDEWAALKRCERTLHRWAEQCCNHDIDERDDGTVIARFMSPTGYASSPQRIPNRRAGAFKRAQRIAAAHGLNVYEQTDPRGCALYVYHPADLAGRDIEECYSSLATCVH